MQIFEYDVVQPPTAGELEKRLLQEGRLSSVVLNIVARRQLDELALRRGDDSPDIAYLMTVHYGQFGDNPFMLGHLDGDTEVVARLEVVNEADIADSERKLHLTVFNPNL